MGIWYVVQNIVLSLTIPFVFLNFAFSGADYPIILPGYLTTIHNETEMSRRAEKKMSGLLRLQIQVRASYVNQPTSERLQAMRKMGMKIFEAEIDRQLIYIHIKRKLNAAKLTSLKKIGVTVYEDSWIPPLENHPTGYVIANVPISRLYDLAVKTYVVKLETAEQV